MKRQLKKLLIFLASGICLVGINAWSTPFPAEVMKWTAAEKEQQRLAGADILKRIYAAAKNNEGRINIPQGIYRFSELQQPAQPTHILLKNVKDFTIEGNGSWFYFEHQASAFKLSNCDNVTIRNINIDSDPLPYAQGTVISLNDNPPRSFVFKPDAGYEMPEMLLRDNVGWSQETQGNRRILLFDKETKLIKADQLSMDIPGGSEPVRKLADGNYEV